ncbi:unnamed protein product, partial [Urochloa humidicola]
MGAVSTEIYLKREIKDKKPYLTELSGDGREFPEDIPDDFPRLLRGRRPILLLLGPGARGPALIAPAPSSLLVPPSPPPPPAVLVAGAPRPAAALAAVAVAVRRRGGGPLPLAAAAAALGAAARGGGGGGGIGGVGVRGGGGVAGSLAAALRLLPVSSHLVRLLVPFSGGMLGGPEAEPAGEEASGGVPYVVVWDRDRDRDGRGETDRQQWISDLARRV